MAERHLSPCSCEHGLATGCIKPSRIQGLMSRSGPRFDVDVSASSCRVNFLASSRIAHQHLHPVSAHGGPTECLGPSKIVVDLHKKNQWASSLTGPKSLFWSGPQTVARPLHMACTAENPFLQQRNPMDNRRPPRRTAAAPRPRRPPRRRQGIAARMSPPVRCPTIPTRVAKFLRRTTMLVAAFSCSERRAGIPSERGAAVRPAARAHLLHLHGRPPAPHLASVAEPSCLRGPGGHLPLPCGDGDSPPRRSRHVWEGPRISL